MRRTLHSSVVGVLTQDRLFEHWWESGPVAVPLFGGQRLPVVFRYDPGTDPPFLAEADAALTTFLAKEPPERAQATALVYADYRGRLSLKVAPPLDLPTPEAIWEQVTPEALHLGRPSSWGGDVDLEVVCDCPWLEEYSLDLVYRGGEKLVRLGNAGETVAADRPGDGEERLLS